jgi:hypothetical protein
MTSAVGDAACKNPLHDHPLPKGYIQGSTEAYLRLDNGWDNPKCPECGRFGWRKP